MNWEVDATVVRWLWHGYSWIIIGSAMDTLVVTQLVVWTRLGSHQLEQRRPLRHMDGGQASLWSHGILCGYSSGHTEWEIITPVATDTGVWRHFRSHRWGGCPPWVT